MSQKFEDLSALIDGEQERSDDVITSVKGDTELMQKWKNYHLIRDGLRKELPQSINVNIADNVMQALESEPAIVAPKKRTLRDIPVIGNVIPFAKQGSQMAVAASVAVAMILGVQHFNQQEVEQPFNAAPPILGIKGGLSPVSFEQTRAVPQTNTAEQKRRVQAYILDHKQQMRFKTYQAPAVELNVEQQQDEGVESDIVDTTTE